MLVRELIEMLLREDGNATVVMCADNGTEDDPADLTCVGVRIVSEGPDLDDVKTVGIWAAWKTTIDTDIDVPLV